jgi:hypothetical protein
MDYLYLLATEPMINIHLPKLKKTLGLLDPATIQHTVVKPYQPTHQAEESMAPNILGMVRTCCQGCWWTLFHMYNSKLMKRLFKHKQ